MSPTPDHAPDLSVRHWRDFRREDWLHVRGGVLGALFGTVLPLASFYAAYRLATFTLAVVLVLAWSLAVFLGHLRRTRRADIFSLTTMLLACLKAAAGLASQSLTLYLLWPSIENLIYAGVLLGSALLGRPVLAAYAERVYPIPASLRATPRFKAVMLRASAVWAGGNLLRAVTRPLLLASLTLAPFLAADTALSWVIGAAMVGFTVWYPLRALGIRAGRAEGHRTTAGRTEQTGVVG